MPKIQEEDCKRAPKGHFAVYVGTHQKRFVVPTAYLKQPSFLQLLEKAADEFGYHGSSIVLPCDESTFELLRSSLDKCS